MVAGSDEADGEVITKLYETGELEYLTWVSKDGVLHNIADEQPDDSYKCYYDTNKKIETKRFKLAYGMSSKFAQDKHWNGMAKYRASEGIVTLKPYTGAVQDTIDEYLGGLRSCMTYISARRLKDIPKCTTFYRVNRILNNDGKGIM
jgi:GMP reductase